MDKDLLIECVKEYPFLYDVANKLHSNNDKKNMAWKEIARKVRAPARECKKTWTLLRDSLRRFIKKQKEQEAENINVSPKKWKYADEMAFLLPYFRYRRSKVLTDDDDDFAYDEESMGEENSISFLGMDNEKIFTEPSAEFTQEEPITQPTKKRRISSCEELSIPEEKTAFATLLQFIIDDKKNADDIQQFFTGITATVRNFPAEDRIIAKAKVFELVTTMELDILNRKDNIYDCSDHDVKSDQERD